ncbi:MAG: CAP domain-containing protein [Rhodobacteraceae bacterium]|nr:CAP domain-containing protein [Paracoccaceae bacterium]
MKRLFAIFTIITVLLSACETSQGPRLGPDGKPLPQVYRISAGESNNVIFRMLDSINALRQAAGAGPVQMNARLNAAAETHSRDMSRQNRPWHFGSDGSSPLDRVARAGYAKTMLGENISETFETELETLAAWMELPGTRNVILDRNATDMGFAWHQEINGKIWWTLLLGG